MVDTTTARLGTSKSVKPAILTPRKTSAIRTTACVGQSRYPELATAKKPEANMPSSEN